jgi:hypothetical protein
MQNRGEDTISIAGWINATCPTGLMSVLHNLVAKLQIPIGLKLSKEEDSDETCEVVRKKQYLLPLVVL